MRILLLLLLPLLLETNPLLAQSEKYIEATMTFKVNYFNGIEPVGDTSFTPINNARFIVIDRDGEIITTGLSNSKGEWIVPIKVERDPRFPTKQMGTVTLITIAKGYNEHIMFNVPVNEHMDSNKGTASVSLNPIKTTQRNEPSILNAGYIHRFTVFETLDYYAKKLGLKKQPQLDHDYLHWGPEVSG
ncbi:hypothetical protein [Paenibacillus sp. V4I5]|uniref:hypothetical protein n=1 Tax=Paenibacillus sp. V4I5 TaxID=3042306 RepID=UPI00278EB880|nr:hypothetical protein [Paenibacillus sp. V4I5]MDQ0914600.1 hypothetical protein [Paenibacillus sp. V4I5]